MLDYLIGYRTCQRCHKKGHKSEMQKVTVINERMKPQQVIYHKSCAEDYYKELSKRYRTFSTNSRSSNGLEKKV